MARVKKSDPALCQMLSLWQPPPKAGDPVGVLATTFTLDTALFEEECLARFADVQSDPLRAVHGFPTVAKRAGGDAIGMH